MKDNRLSLNLNFLWGLAYTQQRKTSHTHMKIESLSERARGNGVNTVPLSPSGRVNTSYQRDTASSTL